MLLIQKISLSDFLNYKEEYVNCLISNSNNDYITEIFVFMDGVNPDLPKSNKIKYFVRKSHNDNELIEYSKE